MKKQKILFLAILSVVFIIVFISFGTGINAHTAPSQINFTKESSNLTPCVGEVFTYVLSFNLEDVGSLPIDALVIDENPAPTYLEIIPSSITGGAVYDPLNDAVIWEGTLVPGSLPNVVTFDVMVIGMPEGVIQYDVKNIAYMYDTNAPGALPIAQASVTITLEGCIAFLPLVHK